VVAKPVDDKRARAIAQQRKPALAAATGILPLDYMLGIMRDPNTDHKRRDAMAMAASPYLHPKLSGVDAKLSTDNAGGQVNEIKVVFVHPTRDPNDTE
jgi:hypothetical protein